MVNRGVILAGGKGSRLGELTKVTNKHLLPVGPFPMIYYPIKKMVGVGIRDILLVSGTEHMGDFVELLGSGKDLGCNLTYKVQDEAGGIAQALGLAQHFCGDSPFLVILGDNIFFDPLDQLLTHANPFPDFAWLALKKVADPWRYGVAEIVNSKIIGIQEKPPQPKSSYAVAGIYLFPPDVFDIISYLKPSSRGELEITDVNRHFLDKQKIGFTCLEGYWTDAGTPNSLLHANSLVHQHSPIFQPRSR